MVAAKNFATGTGEDAWSGIIAPAWICAAP